MVLTKADDFPIHQTPDPVAHAGSDKNFYDRYFFNGYSRSGEGDVPFFGVAMGFYPNLNIADASFSLLYEGQQHNIRASRILHRERLDMKVGPIKIEVVKPLHALRIQLLENESGITADLTFSRRVPPIEEPRFTRREGSRVLMDSTRLTQNGVYEGWIRFRGKNFTLTHDNCWGTRDRSWGVRPVGTRDQPAAPPALPQFYWLWAPINFPESALFYHVNEDAEGRAWNKNALLLPLQGEEERFPSPRSKIHFAPKTRHAQSATLVLEDDPKRQTEIALTTKFHFYMNGLGYLSEEWGHGLYKGESATHYDHWNLSDVDENSLPFLHIQSFCHASMRRGRETSEGYGVLEQLILGPHAPSGFEDILDGAP